MPNRTLQILWLTIESKKGKRFHIPLSMNALKELLDCATDLTAVIGLFVPKRSHVSLMIRESKDVAGLLIQLIDSLTKDRPYHLVDVDAEGIKISVKVK